MELPATANKRALYTKAIGKVAVEVKEIAEADSINVTKDLSAIQHKLDLIADKYQNDEAIGADIYKLYELQAFIHYYNYDDDKARNFIEHAIEVKGGSYPVADKLLRNLKPETYNTDQPTSKAKTANQQQGLVGLGGWLAVFIVGLILGLVVTVYRFFADGFINSEDIAILNDYESGLGDSFLAITNFENISLVIFIGLMITTLILLFLKKKAARAFTIVTILFGAIYSSADYLIASSLLESSGLAESAEIKNLMSKAAGDAGRSILYALVWTPYFIVSKRVKATLTKG